MAKKLKKVKYKKISFQNQKGGVGKTTSTIHLPYLLAQSGYKVLVIDLDAQAHLTKIYCHEIDDKTISGLLLNQKADIKDFIKPAIVIKDKPVIKNGIHQLDKDGDPMYDEEIIPVDNMDIIISDETLAAAAEVIISRAHREKILHKHLSSIESNYDFIFMDCPPALSIITQNAIFTADSFIIPTDYGSFSLDGIEDLFLSIDTVKEGMDYHFKVLRTMKNGASKITNRVVEAQLEDLKDNLFSTIIKRNEAVNQAISSGVPVFLYDNSSAGAKGYRSLKTEVLKIYAD